MIMPPERKSNQVPGSLHIRPRYGVPGLFYVPVRALKRILSGYAWIVMKWTVAVCSKVKMKAEGYENMAPGRAHEHWSRCGESLIPCMFLDVRSAEEYAAVHIADAVLIPIQELASRLQEVPESRRIYVYCHAGWRSARASALLAGAGYTDIVNVLGGHRGMAACRLPGYKMTGGTQ